MNHNLGAPVRIGTGIITQHINAIRANHGSLTSATTDATKICMTYPIRAAFTDIIDLPPPQTDPKQHLSHESAEQAHPAHARTPKTAAICQEVKVKGLFNEVKVESMLIVETC